MDQLPPIQPLPDKGIVVMMIPAHYPRAMREEMFMNVKKAKELSGSKATFLMLPDDVKLFDGSQLQAVPQQITGVGEG